MSVLYVSRNGAELGKHGERLQVRFGQEILASLPIETVERVVVLGHVQVTSAVIHWLLEAEIPLFFCTTAGRYLGTLSAGQQDADRTVRQVLAVRDHVSRLSAVNAIISCKIQNQISILRRHYRTYGVGEVESAIALLENVKNRLEKTNSIASMRGVEGRAGAIYFSVFGLCLRQSEIKFNGRNRRPPRDPANALLSLGYMLLLAEASLALSSEGLHTGVGYLHETSSRHPSLALDFIELFRQPMVDRLVLALFNRRVLTADDFEITSEHGCKLSEAALRSFIKYFEQAISIDCITHGEDKKTSFRTLIRNTAREWKLAIDSDNPLTVPPFRL